MLSYHHSTIQEIFGIGKKLKHTSHKISAKDEIGQSILAEDEKTRGIIIPACSTMRKYSRIQSGTAGSANNLS
jgi:hypothetical protein